MMRNRKGCLAMGIIRYNLVVKDPGPRLQIPTLLLRIRLTMAHKQSSIETIPRRFSQGAPFFLRIQRQGSATMMRVAGFAFAFILTMVGGAEAATAAAIAEGQFLEGVIFVGEKLYFVDYSASDVLQVNGDRIVKLWHREGCGANGLVSTGDKLLVACYDQGTVVTISFDGTTLDSISADDGGRSFVSPNDLVSDAKGGFYLTSSGRNSIRGAVTYFGPDKRVRTVATGLSNANGIALSPDGKLLYVGESDASRVLSYPVEANGTLGAATVLVSLGEALSGSPQGRYVPDGLRTDRDGNLYVCLYRGGGLAIFDPTGKLLKQVELPAAHHTSLALSDDEQQIFVTGIDDEPNGSYRGGLYAVPNPIHR